MNEWEKTAAHIPFGIGKEYAPKMDRTIERTTENK